MASGPTTKARSRLGMNTEIPMLMVYRIAHLPDRLSAKGCADFGQLKNRRPRAGGGGYGGWVARAAAEPCCLFKALGRAGDVDTVNRGALRIAMRPRASATLGRIRGICCRRCSSYSALARMETDVKPSRHTWIAPSDMSSLETRGIAVHDKYVGVSGNG